MNNARQLKGDLKPGAHPRNKRAHSQDREFVDHVKRSMDYFIRKPVQQEILFPEQKPTE